MLIYSFMILRGAKSTMMLSKITRILSIGIVLIFGVSFMGVGAADRPSCDLSSCMRISGMTDSLITPLNPMDMSHQSSTTCGCCSGSQDMSCDVENSTPFDNQAYTVSLVAGPTGDPSGMELTASHSPTDVVNLKPTGLHHDLKRNPRSSPIYLQNLSLLI